jgi:atypical dual specificity phosphatase
MCDEYRGPIKKYEQLGMRQLWLPTVDHFEPSLDQLKEAVAFLEEHEALNKKVYVHCRAGHGRSAAVVFAWMLYKNPNANPQFLNQQLCNQRHVRKTLWKQPNLQQFHSWLLTKDGARSSMSRLRRSSDTNNHELNRWLDAEVDGHNSDTDVGCDNSSDDDRDYQQ